MEYNKLLKSIISLANCQYNGNRYLIFGVDDKNFKVKGLTKRYENSDLQNFLDDQHFAGENVPDVEVKHLDIDGKAVDVFIIKNKPSKPYYLTEKNSEKLTHAIWTRHKDRNSTANYSEVKEMWREQLDLKERTELNPIKDNNSLIKLPKPFYFNIDDLIKERKTIEASVELSDVDIKKIIKLEHMPNNIDTFNKEKGGYIFKSSSGKEGHKGIIPYYLDTGTVSESNIVYLVFEYINPQKDTNPNLKITKITDLKEVKLVEGISYSEHKKLLSNLKTVTNHLAELVQQEKENQLKDEKYDANSRIIWRLRSRLIKYFNVDPSFLEYYYNDKQIEYNIEEELSFLNELKKLLNKEDFESIKKKIIDLRDNENLKYLAIIYNILGGERITELCIEIDTNELSEEFFNNFIKEINIRNVNMAITNLENKLSKIKNKKIKRYNIATLH